MFHLRAFALLAVQRNKRQDKFRLMLHLRKTYFVDCDCGGKRVDDDEPLSCDCENKMIKNQLLENLFD